MPQKQRDKRTKTGPPRNVLAEPSPAESSPGQSPHDSSSYAPHARSGFIVTLRNHGLFLLILIFAAVSRFSILFYSQAHVNADEAIIGLMGKHILEGRQHFVLYMLGQAYNAGAVGEAYLASISFALFGVGVAPLKACLVILSLICLVCFYWMANRLYGRRTATLAALVFALSPSMLKWHFEVRGYSFYFLSFPVLTALFLSIDGRSSDSHAADGHLARLARKIFFFGLLSGLSVLNLELGLPFIAVLWLLLALRGKLSPRNALAGAGGFLVGYMPAIIFNLAHDYINWRAAFFSKTGGGALANLLHPATWVEIFFREMPKFFGRDTVLWYYPETPAFGVVLYLVALLAVAAALWPFLKTPTKIVRALREPSAEDDENRDFLMLVLTAACFIPYLVSQDPSSLASSNSIRVPSYFLGGCFFLSVLMARLVERCVSPVAPRRLAGIALLAAIVAAGVAALIETGGTNEIETLSLFRNERRIVMTRFPGQDIECVERHLSENRITAVWTSFSFVYPLIFESREGLAASSQIFGWERSTYPEKIARPPKPGERMAVVIESDSRFRSDVEASRAKETGGAPAVTDCGSLVVIE